MKWGPRASPICIGNMATSLLTPALNVYEQMAVDETLARESVAEPVLRFYHWTAGPAVTFGYAQFYELVRQQVPLQAGPLCRRPTGGGLVFHGQDLTFSLIFPSETLRPQVMYARLHGAIEQAFVQAGMIQPVRQKPVAPAAYAPQQNGIASGCFARPVEDDLLADGHKILGGALRRFEKVTLYQGSLQVPGARSQVLFRRAIVAGLEKLWGISFQTEAISAPLLAAAKQLALTVYQTDAWTKKFL